VPIVIGIAGLFGLPESIKYMAIRESQRDKMEALIAEIRPDFKVPPDARFVIVGDTNPHERPYFTVLTDLARNLGGDVDVPTLEGKAHLKVPAGTQSGQMFKLRGKGIMNMNGRDRGDLLARLIVEVPSRLNAEQRRKLEEFAALCGEENTPLRKSFFERAKEFFQ